VDYLSSGVDQNANDEFVGRIKRLAHILDARGVIGDLGSFSGLFDIGGFGYREPVLAAATDGVGSKLEIAFALENHHTVGIDLVAMCVNDVVTCGARPLFFLDYMALGRLDLAMGEAIVAGIVEGCRQAGCALLGGETAQLPTFYSAGRYDLAGFAVGIVERSRVIDGSRIVPGDVVVSLASSGVHSNGFSLVREIIASQGLDLAEKYADNRTLGEELLTPTRIYVKEIMSLLSAGVDVKGIAHITGGGVPGNFARTLPEGIGARLFRGRWPEPRIFADLQRWGNVSDREMFDVFNMGLGMLLVVTPSDAARVLELLREGYVVGECVEGESVSVVN